VERGLFKKDMRKSVSNDKIEKRGLPLFATGKYCEVNEGAAGFLCKVGDGG